MFPTAYIHTTPTDPQDAVTVAICGNRKCRGEVYSGETMYLWEGVWLCPDCFKSAVESLLSENPRQLALELDLDMRVYEYRGCRKEGITHADEV